MNESFTKQEILNQLDDCCDRFEFPMLDNGYIHPVNSRLSTFRDHTRWAVIIEVVGFSYRGGGHGGINNCLHVYGNCLDYEPGIKNENFLRFTDNSDQGYTFDQDYYDHLNINVSTMLLRDKEISINHSIQHYKELGIELEEPPKIMIWEFLRGLLVEHRSEFLATEQEIRERIPNDILRFMTLDEWNHPDVCEGEIPSENECFIQLAEALEQNDKSLYKPMKKPNNHWKNWPDGGAL